MDSIMQNIILNSLEAVDEAAANAEVAEAFRSRSVTPENQVPFYPDTPTPDMNIEVTKEYACNKIIELLNNPFCFLKVELGDEETVYVEPHIPYSIPIPQPPTVPYEWDPISWYYYNESVRIYNEMVLFEVRKYGERIRKIKKLADWLADDEKTNTITKI